MNRPGRRIAQTSRPLATPVHLLLTVHTSVHSSAAVHQPTVTPATHVQRRVLPHDARHAAQPQRQLQLAAQAAPRLLPHAAGAAQLAQGVLIQGQGAAGGGGGISGQGRREQRLLQRSYKYVRFGVTREVTREVNRGDSNLRRLVRMRGGRDGVVVGGAAAVR